MADTRIYIITKRMVAQGEDGSPRLVRAANPARALRHVTDEFNVAIASQDDLVRCLSRSVPIEEAEASSPKQALADSLAGAPGNRTSGGAINAGPPEGAAP